MTDRTYVQKIKAAGKHLLAARQRRLRTGFLVPADVRWLIRELKPTMEEGPYPLPPIEELARIGFAVVKDIERIRRRVLLIDWRQRMADEGPEDGGP